VHLVTEARGRDGEELVDDQEVGVCLSLDVQWAEDVLVLGVERALQKQVLDRGLSDVHRREHRAGERARCEWTEEAIVRDPQGGGDQCPPSLARLVISALEADELTADRLMLDLTKTAPSAYLLDSVGKLIDREPGVRPGSTDGSARVVPDRWH